MHTLLTVCGLRGGCRINFSWQAGGHVLAFLILFSAEITIRYKYQGAIIRKKTMLHYIPKYICTNERTSWHTMTMMMLSCCTLFNSEFKSYIFCHAFKLNQHKQMRINEFSMFLVPFIFIMNPIRVPYNKLSINLYFVVYLCDTYLPTQFIYVSVCGENAMANCIDLK